MSCTRDAYPCANVEKDPYGSTLTRGIDTSRSEKHCRCGDPKSTNTTVASLTKANWQPLTCYQPNFDWANDLIVNFQFDFLPVYLWTVSRTLNSLFKVLFNCPSRYLCAIGLAIVFSLRWSLPPTSVCNPKQTDSKDCHHRRSSARGYDNRPFTCYGQTTIKRSRVARPIGYNRQFPTPQLLAAIEDSRIRLWAYPISLAVTLGIIVIFFFSA